MISKKLGDVVRITNKSYAIHNKIGIITDVDYFEDFPIRVKIQNKIYHITESDIKKLNKNKYPEYFL